MKNTQALNNVIESKRDIEYSSYFVLTNDSFFSHSPVCRGINTLILPCDTRAEAEIVAQNARWRTDQTHVRILSGFAMQRYTLRFTTHVYQLKTKNEYPSWYEDGYFSYLNH